MPVNHAPLKNGFEKHQSLVNVLDEFFSENDLSCCNREIWNLTTAYFSCDDGDLPKASYRSTTVYFCQQVFFLFQKLAQHCSPEVQERMRRTNEEWFYAFYPNGNPALRWKHRGRTGGIGAGMIIILGNGWRDWVHWARNTRQKRFHDRLFFWWPFCPWHFIKEKRTKKKGPRRQPGPRIAPV